MKSHAVHINLQLHRAHTLDAAIAGEVVARWHVHVLEGADVNAGAGAGQGMLGRRSRG